MKLREKRQELGISQVRLAVMSGISNSSVSSFETGRLKPWPKARRALAHALGIPEQEIFPEYANENHTDKP